MYSSLQFIISQLQQRGFDTASIIAGTTIQQTDIDDPWPYLSYQQYHGLIDNIYRLSNDPAIGIHLNETFRPFHIGAPGFAAMTSTTFSEARKIIMHYRVLKDPFIYLSHHLNSDNWDIELCSSYTAEQHINRFSIEGHAIRTALFCQHITGRDDCIEALHVSYPQPDYAALYEQKLACQVKFNESHTTLRLNRDILKQALPAANARIHQLCVEECNLQLSLLDEKSSFAKKVYQELFRSHNQQNKQLLSLSEVANRLYISPRSLRRKLLNEHSSFQIISNEARRDLGFHYLKNTHLSTKEIAFNLGYSSVNNFHRAFKQWTGKPISAYLDHSTENNH